MSKKTITVRVKHRTSPRPRHDGTIGQGLSVFYDDEPHTLRSGDTVFVKSVMLSNTAHCIALIPQEALSLLSWLQQERGILEQMVRGQA